MHGEPEVPVGKTLLYTASLRRFWRHPDEPFTFAEAFVTRLGVVHDVRGGFCIAVDTALAIS